MSYSIYRFVVEQFLFYETVTTFTMMIINYSLLRLTFYLATFVLQALAISISLGLSIATVFRAIVITTGVTLSLIVAITISYVKAWLSGTNVEDSLIDCIFDSYNSFVGLTVPWAKLGAKDLMPSASDLNKVRRVICDTIATFVAMLYLSGVLSIISFVL